MSIRDVPVIGQIVGVLGFFVDLLLNSGELVVMLLFALLDNVELVASIVVMLQRLENTIPFLPTEFVQTFSTLIFTAMLVVYLGRLLGKLRENRNATQN